MCRPETYTLTPDGKIAISGGGNSVLFAYDTGTGGKRHDFIGHTSDVWGVAVSPDGRSPDPLPRERFRVRMKKNQSSKLPAGPLSPVREAARETIFSGVHSEGFSILSALGPGS